MANRSTKKSPKKRKTKTVKAKKSVELKGGEILRDEIFIIALFVFSILLMLSNFGLGGKMGGLLKGVQLGSFGTVGYLFPIVVFLIGVILVSNKGNIRSGLKSLAITVVLISVSSIVHIFMDNTAFSLDALKEAYSAQNGGGLFGSLLGGSLKSVLSSIGAFIVLCMIIIIALVYISERSFVSFVKLGSKKVYKQTKEDMARRKAKKDKLKNSNTAQRKKVQKQKDEEAYQREDVLVEEEIKPRMKIDFATTTLNVADNAHTQNKAEYKVEHFAKDEDFEVQEDYPMQDDYYEQDDYAMQGETAMQDGYAMQGESTMQDAYVTQDGYIMQDEFDEQDEFAIQEEIAKARNITSISTKRERKKNKDTAAYLKKGKAEKASISGRNIKKVQDLSDIITKKPEDMDEDILNKLNGILYADSPKAVVESDFGNELELTAEMMMNEGLVNEDAYESRFDTFASKSKTSKEADISAYEKEADFEDDEYYENYEYKDDDEETYTDKINSSDFSNSHLDNVTTASGKVIARDADLNSNKIKTYENKKPQTQVNTKVLAARQNIEKPVKQYVYPPTTLLNSGPKISNKSNEEFKSTAAKLQETLHNFGIEVQVSNISIGPTVTRYEILPEPGVKVSKIVGLTDDIKLNLAASDIRIEAPIPGKSAVGIEVPNKENTIVSLRELFESEEFKNTKAKLSFALGKDIAGKPIVSDIATMPHLLIAGATGAGKSVCINTLIMSVLYKYTPQEVRLIMVDPKVVELSVYNGIPHLLIPVVTDPKKAAGALNWAVKEMTDRYKKFAEHGVRNLKGYNDKLSTIEPDFEKLPQILIIIDELADLMMVAQNEVEDAICRLAQLARACGIHLVIATQRPSVNVITGLIKANIPSRIAFAVSSGIDSRTILDTVGAEKLLGKGDMLFSPQSLPKPIRVQGAFVSDAEVQNVVDFLVEQGLDVGFDESAINNVEEGIAENSSAAANEFDELFVQVGRFIIESQKASIGNLQRVFRIGFNRAARIMDQLYEAGVVGKEQGTKPRQVLMTLEEFEQYIET